ncbi:L-arabinose isomerase [Gallibacterium anatis]|uniref:L-arabinose isomerase n=1 Tax=Gallibacterium anatis TaxID=750 RepID=UPI0039FC2801
MKKIYQQQLWFITGSQTLYGEEVLATVDKDSQEIVASFNQSQQISMPIIYKGTAKSPTEIYRLCLEANNDENCVGIILWMHTFSPAKMWIKGLKNLNKPFVHLHTQFNAELPWQTIDMNFMNTNQSAHGDREFGFICSRLGINRKVIVGHWNNKKVHVALDQWGRAAIGWNEAQHLKVARFGDNMRQVAVTEGNKVSAQIQFGFEVNAYSVGSLAKAVDAVSEEDVENLIQEYCEQYEIAEKILTTPALRKVLQQEARLEIGLERFLAEKGCKAFTNNFEDLVGLTNLPGLATQRLMAKGYGFGGEGDWKTAAMTRIVKVMTQGLSGGTSFMEDYTYHFSKEDQVLGAHMLEVCPSIAAARPRLEIHLHTIGCKCNVARLVFTGKAGKAINLSLIDLGDHFRFVSNHLETVTPAEDMPNLPVARALWKPLPNLEVSGEAWIYAGAAHHSTYSQAVTQEMLNNFADIANVEMVVIDENTEIRTFKQRLS